MKKFMTIMSCLVIVLLLVGITTAFAAATMDTSNASHHSLKTGIMQRVVTSAIGVMICLAML